MPNDITVIFKRQGLPRKKTVIVGSTRLEVYSIGWLSLYARVSNETIRLWERKSILPKPVLKLPGGKRFYSPTEIKLYAKTITEHYQDGRDLNDLKNRLRHIAHKVSLMFRTHTANNSIPESERNLPVNLLLSQLQNER